MNVVVDESRENEFVGRVDHFGARRDIQVLTNPRYRFVLDINIRPISRIRSYNLTVFYE